VPSQLRLGPERTDQRGGVLDRRAGALAEVGRHRVRRVAEQSHLALRERGQWQLEVVQVVDQHRIGLSGARTQAWRLTSGFKPPPRTR
jgi:hypothetical protein